jgi:hypothetical protein
MRPMPELTITSPCPYVDSNTCTVHVPRQPYASVDFIFQSGIYVGFGLRDQEIEDNAK